ncbi:hypothetical protein GGR56DRAFT_633318 [Xylariaceae sp. FL0804]|nr:hypothetical protein GGR56DRAFT_633318 [Xylariaceae sp. FL0804]
MRRPAALLEGIFALLALASSSTSFYARAATLTLVIPAHLPHQQLPPSTHATLSALILPSSPHTPTPPRRFSAPLDTAGAFVFRNVTPGVSYLCDVHGAGHAFAPLRVDVAPPPYDAADEAAARGENPVSVPASTAGRDGDGLLREGGVRVWETFRGNDWDNRGEELPSLRGRAGPAGGGGDAFEVRVLGPKVYYAERGSFSIVGILKNPMIIMGLVSMALFIGMPKMIENMDPEMRAEFEEQQKSNPMANIMGGQSSGPGNFDVAGFLSGHNNNKDDGGQESSGGAGKKGGRR